MAGSGYRMIYSKHLSNKTEMRSLLLEGTAKRRMLDTLGLFGQDRLRGCVPAATKGAPTSWRCYICIYIYVYIYIHIYIYRTAGRSSERSRYYILGA